MPNKSNKSNKSNKTSKHNKSNKSSNTTNKTTTNKSNAIVPKLGLPTTKPKRQRRSGSNGNELELWKKFMKAEQQFLEDEASLDFQSPYHHFVINTEAQEQQEKIEHVIIFHQIQ